MVESEDGGNLTVAMERKIYFSLLEDLDLKWVKEIYDYYILNSTAIYYTELQTEEDIRRILPMDNPPYKAYAIRDEKGIPLGFCYYGPYSEREAYQVTVEITIYLRSECVGHHIGMQVMDRLEADIRKNKFRNIVSLVDSENVASCRLMEKAGFVCCGIIRNVAEKFGRKCSLSIYQKELQ